MTKLIFSIENAADKQLMLALGRRLNLPVEEMEGNEMSDANFWRVIELIHPANSGTGLEEAINALAEKKEAEIKSFADVLSEKLFALDKRQYVRAIVGKDDGSYFSPDHFLDARAFVVASGRDFYESVLLGTAGEANIGIYEGLLSLPAKAWKLKTGTDFDHLPVKNYFTYSNPDGWETTLLSQTLAK